jgi:hypothetical protein
MMQELAVRPRVVLFDLENVDYISSTGWGQFARCAETLQDWNGVVALYGLDQDLHDIYSCLEFRAFISAYPDRDRAIAGATAGAGTPGEAGRHRTPGEPDRAGAAGPVERPDDAAEVEAPETFDESTVESVDDIFADGDVAPTAGEPVAEKPAAPDTHRWPGDPDTRADVEPVERPAEPREHQPPDEPEEPGHDRDEPADLPPVPRREDPDEHRVADEQRDHAGLHMPDTGRSRRTPGGTPAAHLPRRRELSNRTAAGPGFGPLGIRRGWPDHRAPGSAVWR